MEKYEKVILVTGGLGFIGSHIVRHLVNTHPEWRIINMDCLSYAGNVENLEDIHKSSHKNYAWVNVDIRNEKDVRDIFYLESITDVIHLAAESHVDRSVSGPKPFIDTNIVGTFNLLEAARKYWKDEPDHKFYYFSTDEVFGYLNEGEEPFNEEHKLDPTSPYSASKACGDLLAKAYFKTFKLPVVISHMCNAVGGFQNPEKLIPATIQRILNGEPIIVYDQGLQVREWIYTDDIVSAAMCVFEKGVPGEAYNIGSGNECRNIDLVNMIIAEICRLKPEEYGHKTFKFNFVENARPGHDFRYAINNSKVINNLGWEGPKNDIKDCVKKTVQWYLDNQEWVNNLKERNKK